jgi:hypothetical protein
MVLRREVRTQHPHGRQRHREMRHELGRGLALFSGEDADAREEIVIREGGGESEHVRIHAPCLSR